MAPVIIYMALHDFTFLPYTLPFLPCTHYINLHYYTHIYKKHLQQILDFLLKQT